MRPKEGTTIAEDMISFLASTLGQAGVDHVPFEWLSDEETAAIEQPGKSDYTVRPWIQAQDDIDPSVCMRFGERSLLLRGLLEPDAHENGRTVLVPSLSLRRVIRARQDGIGYLLGRAVHDDSHTALYHVLQPSIGSFEEQVDDQGIHVYSACTYRAALSRLADWALPGTDHAGAQMRTRIPVGRWSQWLLNELGADVRIVELTVFLPDATGRLAGKTWHLAHAHGVGVLATTEDEHSLQVASVTRARLTETLTRQVSSALHVSISLTDDER